MVELFKIQYMIEWCLSVRPSTRITLPAALVPTPMWIHWEGFSHHTEHEGYSFTWMYPDTRLCSRMNRVNMEAIELLKHRNGGKMIQTLVALHIYTWTGNQVLCCDIMNCDSTVREGKHFFIVPNYCKLLSSKLFMLCMITMAVCMWSIGKPR